MATLNFIMPKALSEGFCDREAKQNKILHAWMPSGQTKAIAADQIAIECYCRHCKLREWSHTSRADFAKLQAAWSELQ
jgi:hypothetical protein